MALDSLEASLEEAADECVIPNGECHRGVSTLVFVGAGESADDKAPVVGGVFPQLFRRILVGLAAVAGESVAFVFVEEHSVLGKNLPEDVVSFVGDFGRANKGDVIEVSKKPHSLPTISGYATLVTKYLPESSH